MYKLEPTSQFRKDFKSIPENKYAAIEKVFDILSEIGTLPYIPYRTHKLIGNYSGYYEAHIESDLLIIWFKVSKDNVISLTRIGSHSKLFKNNNNKK